MVVATKQTKKPTTTHKKRHGSHQRRSNHFMKAYWPYIPIALIIGVGVIFNSIAIRPSVLSYATNMTSSGLLAETNTERAKNNLGTLVLNDDLTKAAQAKAEDMAERNYWSHTTPDGQEPWEFITATGYRYLSAGENLAYGFSTSDQAIVGWMNSPGHRANILNTDYREVGFGIVNSSNYQQNGEQTIVVALYAKPVSADATASATQTDNTVKQDNPDQGQPIAVSKPKSGDENDIVVSARVPGPKKVAHVQMATSGAAPWSLIAATTVTILLLAIFLARHSLAWHRALRRGEAFVLKHKYLDIIVVFAITGLVLASQAAGYIQ